MRKQRKKRRFWSMKILSLGLAVVFAAGFSTQEAAQGWPDVLWAGLSGTGHGPLSLSGTIPIIPAASAPDQGSAAAASGTMGAGVASAGSSTAAASAGTEDGVLSADDQKGGKPAASKADLPLHSDGKQAAAAVSLSKPTEKQAAYKAKPGSKLVALTFDDGPDAVYTPQILTILKKMNAHATFFTVGTQVKKYPGIMKRIVSEGNEIGNHSYHHPNLTKMDDNKIKSEILWTDTLIQRSIGFVPDLFRAPYGDVSPEVKAIVKNNGRALVGWTVDTRDWAGEPIEAMRENVNKNTRPGGIILMHCFGGKYIKNTPVLLPLIIKDLQDKGYTFVTVGQLIASKVPVRAIN